VFAYWPTGLTGSARMLKFGKYAHLRLLFTTEGQSTHLGEVSITDLCGS
jgi:hypothetical protein